MTPQLKTVKQMRIPTEKEKEEKVRPGMEVGEGAEERTIAPASRELDAEGREELVTDRNCEVKKEGISDEHKSSRESQHTLAVCKTDGGRERKRRNEGTTSTYTGSRTSKSHPSGNLQRR